MKIELEALIKQYNDGHVKDIVENWQNSSTVKPLICPTHNVSLKYSKGKLYCPEKSCEYQQHWIPSSVIKHWEKGL
jgi:hypothetical protein